MRINLFALLFLLFAGCTAAREFHTASFAIEANCAQCETLIEEAVYKKKEAEANWDPATKQVYLVFDSRKTSAEAIYKRIAYAGFDTPLFRAPDEVYASLPACCKYKRAPLATGHDHAAHQLKENPEAHTAHKGHVTAPAPQKPESTDAHDYDLPRVEAEGAPAPAPAKNMTEPKKAAPAAEKADAHKGHEGHMPAPAKQPVKTPAPKPAPAKQTAQNGPLREVYARYFALKDALVRDDAADAAKQAASLKNAVQAAPMGKMSGTAHDLWMRHYQSLAADARKLAATKDLEQQRMHFAALSATLHKLVKAFPPQQTVYYQHCPMFNKNKGANWLSTQKTIRNPYYGQKMLSCGKTVETIQ